MRPAALLVLAAALLGPAALAQEAPTPAETRNPDVAEATERNLEIWKWANFVVLAAGLGYLIGKNAGPFFASRSRQIRKDMIEAQETRRHAEERAAEVDRRLAGLEAAIAGLKADSEREAQNETERLRRHTAEENAKIQAHAEQEIASAGKAARMELKRYAAALAIQLAEQRIRARMNPEAQESLVRGFVRDLEPPSSSAAI